jgi:hypothetical protein
MGQITKYELLLQKTIQQIAIRQTSFGYWLLARKNIFKRYTYITDRTTSQLPSDHAWLSHKGQKNFILCVKPLSNGYLSCS